MGIPAKITRIKYWREALSVLNIMMLDTKGKEGIAFLEYLKRRLYVIK